VEQTFKLLAKTFRLSIVVASLGLAYSILMPLVSPWLFGPAYSPGVQLGQLLCIRYCFAILTCPLGLIGYNLGLVRVYWVINLLQFGAVVGINLLLIPVMGPAGAAIALIVNEFVGALCIGALIWSKVKSSAQALAAGKAEAA
jgi:O-antigen/teichoic acid export membrane protein